MCIAGYYVNVCFKRYIFTLYRVVQVICHCCIANDSGHVDMAAYLIVSFSLAFRQRVDWLGHVPVLGSGSAYDTYGFSSKVTTFK